MDAHAIYLDNLGNCNDDGHFEAPEQEEALEPEAEVLDRLDVALAEAWEMLRHTNAGQIQ